MRSGVCMTRCHMRCWTRRSQRQCYMQSACAHFGSNTSPHGQKRSARPRTRFNTGMQGWREKVYKTYMMPSLITTWYTWMWNYSALTTRSQFKNASQKKKNTPAHFKYILGDAKSNGTLYELIISKARVDLKHTHLNA
jgi:hypothetical protein